MNRLILATSLGLTCFSISAMAQELIVHPTLLDDRKAVIATVESVHEVQARARISGTLSLLTVKEGDHVKAGDKIAIVGDPKLAIKGQGLDSRILGAQSAYDKAKLDFARASELRQSGYATQAKLDEARANLEIAQHALDAAKSEKQEVAQQATEGAVLAPNAGRILKVPVSVGSVVMTGETIATLSQENYILRLDLPERHARFIQVGDTVQIGSRGLGAQCTEAMKTGTVRLVYPEIKNGRVTADVTALDLGDYFVGERARVYVTTGTRPAFLVPQDYLFRRAGVSFLKLKDGGPIVVQAGETQGDKIEILSGLDDGDVVVTP